MRSYSQAWTSPPATPPPDVVKSVKQHLSGSSDADWRRRAKIVVPDCRMGSSTLTLGAASTGQQARVWEYSGEIEVKTLRKDTANDTGPPSTNRPITRTSTAQSISSLPEANTDTGKPASATVDVSTFKHYGFADTPSGSKETPTVRAARNSDNFARLADLFGNLDGRVGHFERKVANLQTEFGFVAGARSTSDVLASTVEAPVAKDASKQTDSSHSDVGSVDDVGILDHLNDLDQEMDEILATTKGHTAHIAALDNRIDEVDGQISRLAPPFSIIHMSNAVAAQFKLQRSDIAALNQRLDDQSAAHAKATKIHDKTFTQLQATVAALETTIVRQGNPLTEVTKQTVFKSSRIFKWLAATTYY
ncbi:hypothetical protein C8J57DRAFT_1237690 [Mycena rebaudengoi]|nr:hypothetical protein C8J57DRAFT_1237690 [Mycena rebaudengoi]